MFMILGLLLGYIATSLVEFYSLAHGTKFPSSLALILLGAGAALGLSQGLRWWQIIYVEKRYRHRKKN